MTEESKLVVSYILVWLIYLAVMVVVLSGCQTIPNTPLQVTLTECSRACYPGRMASADIYNGACKCTERGEYDGK